jgi:stringent starvation protein B
MTTGETTSTRPYLIRALYEWCTDNGLTPHLAVCVDSSVQVPQEFVKQGEIVLNVSFDATSSLKLGDEFIEFKGRFAGIPREILVPVRQVMAIYARENGQGMSFPLSDVGVNESTAAPSSKPSGTSAREKRVKNAPGNLASVASVADQGGASGSDSKESTEPRGSRPTLTRIK